MTHFPFVVSSLISCDVTRDWAASCIPDYPIIPCLFQRHVYHSFRSCRSAPSLNVLVAMTSLTVPLDGKNGELLDILFHVPFPTV